MKKRIGMMALMAIMLLCSAMTCSGGDDADDRYSGDGYLVLRGTTWESTSWQITNQWYSDYEGGHKLTITFHDATYEARFNHADIDSNGNHTSGGTHYYGGNYELSDTFIAEKYNIHCYDGSSNDERIRFEVISQGSIRLEGNVFFPRLGETYRVVMMKI